MESSTIGCKGETQFRYRLIPLLQRKGHKILSVKMLNKNRHRVVQTNLKKFYILYKNGWFYTYSREFPDQRCLGESINVEYLKYCLQHEVDDIIIIHNEDNQVRIYSIPARKWWEYANANHTFREVEKPDIEKDFGELVAKTELTASIPVTELQRIDNENLN